MSIKSLKLTSKAHIVLFGFLVAEKPQSVLISNVESRRFTVHWSEPAQIYSSENLGYIVQVDAGGSCFNELIVRCNDCDQRNMINVSIN